MNDDDLSHACDRIDLDILWNTVRPRVLVDFHGV